MILLPPWPLQEEKPYAAVTVLTLDLFCFLPDATVFASLLCYC